MTSSKYILFLVLSSLMFSSCTEFLKGKPKKEEVIEVQQESMSCLRTVSLEVSQFMRSESSNEQIDATFACIDQTLAQFQTRVEGRAEASSFTADELFEIFDRFVEDADISRAATQDLLTLKAALLGGTDQKITKAEIGQLREYLLLIREEAKKLLPYAQLFTFQRTETAFTKERIREGFVQLNQSLRSLLSSSRFAQSNYGYEDFRRMILNLSVLPEGQQDMLVLADRVNGLLVGTQGAANQEDRLLYVDNLTEVLRLYSTFIHEHVKFEFRDAATLSGVLEFIEDATKLLENSLQYRKTRLISAETIDPLLTEVFRNELLPMKLTPETALRFYRTVLVRVFDSGLRGDMAAFTGIRHVHFTNLKRELAVYKIYSKFIATLASPEIIARAPNNRIPLRTLQSQLRALNPERETDILQPFDRETKTLIVRIVNELKAEFLTGKPSIYNNKKLVLSFNQNDSAQNWADLTRGFYVKMLARQMLLGWGQTPLVKEVKDAYATERGMIQWYAEFKSFGIEMKSMDPRVDNQGAASVAAANLFTAAGNGDKRMNFAEAVQSLNILVSGGQTFNELQQGLMQARCQLPERDVFELPWQNENCMYQEIQRNYRRYFSNFPSLVAVLNASNPAQFTDFFKALMDAARRDDDNRNVRVESADIKTMISLLYYMESLYSAHDTNKNLLLSPTEIRAAYPKFKDFATEFANSNSQAELTKFNGWLARAAYSCYTVDDLIRESFIFMLYNGRTPEQADLSTLPCVTSPGILNRLTPDSWETQRPLIHFEGEVNRRTILNTFKILKTVLGS